MWIIDDDGGDGGGLKDKPRLINKIYLFSSDRYILVPKVAM